MSVVFEDGLEEVFRIMMDTYQRFESSFLFEAMNEELSLKSELL